ncbi:MAG TPA: hypothetical protein VK462_08450, partial [Nitrososphaeraceae archaeon]|nr:hypothetical protein [Nitrososphaeraceae archaeon]
MSRVDPCLLCFKQTNATYSSQYICYRGLSVPTRLLMMGILYDDKTQEPFPIGQKGNFIKSMVILPFAMEIERNVTATCVVAGVDEFVGSIDG